MHLESFSEVKKITENLVSVPSVVCAPGQETNCAHVIFDYFNKLPYFNKYPHHTYVFQTEDDNVVRHSTMAYVKGNAESNETVVLMGHIDTVDVEDFGPDSTIAFDSKRVIDYLSNIEGISEEVKQDIESDEYMFGRGCLDMKSGVASHMFVIKHFSEHPEQLNGNVIFIAHCDEEDMSHGILTGLKELGKLKEKENFEYVAAINADYTTPYYKGDQNRYVHYGAVGKLLPSFYIIGREAHVGNPYAGLDPNLIAAKLTENIDLNVELCDEALGEMTVPPVSLRQADLKTVYTVQTADTAYCYYNFFTHKMSPKDVMKKIKEVAIQTFDEICEKVNLSYREYCKKNNFTYSELPWKSRVMSYEEFYEELKEIHGNKFVEEMEKFSLALNRNEPGIDLRVFSMKVIAEAWKWAVDKSPAIIIYFSSSYCPRVEVIGRDEREKRLIEAIRKAVKDEQPYCSNTIVERYFFPYISDASFMAVCDDDESLLSLEKNMPAWGIKYRHKIEDIKRINIPVANIGTYGKDGHMYTERVEKKYTFENLPNLIYKAVINILE